MNLTTHILSQQSFWRVSKVLVKKLGLLKAFALTDLIDKYDYYSSTNQLNNGKFFYRREDIKELWGVEVDTQRKFITEFVEKGFIEYEVRGPLPKKGYYSVNANKIVEFINDNPIDLYTKPAQEDNQIESNNAAQ